MLALSQEKTFFGVSDKVRQKPGFTATEDGQRLEILCDVEGSYVLCSEKKGTDQLQGHR